MSDRQKNDKMVLNKTRPEYNKIRLIFLRSGTNANR